MNAAVIGKRLVHLRGAKTREEVSKSVGISVSALAMYELGNRIPRDEIKLALSRFYGISVQALFFDQ